MRYEGIVYRPPSEAESLLIQATIGCPHNRCTFCGMYRTKKFKIRPVADIKEDLKRAQELYGNDVESIFFPVLRVYAHIIRQKERLWVKNTSRVNSGC